MGLRLPDITVLKGAIERLVADNASAQDREQVQAALAAGALSIATGERAVSLGGDANGAVIATGDGNVILHVGALGVAALDRLMQRRHPSPLHQLPADVADFVGRGTQMEKLLGVLSVSAGRAVISAIHGMGGLGKTTLAVHVAHRLTDRYPDGQIVVDMAATSATPLSSVQGLARVIRVFEPLMQLPDTVTELRPIYLHVLRGKRVLLILDNALDGDQVAPLLPPEDCALIITSRRRIAVAGLERVDLDLLASGEATGLLRSIVGEGRATAAELSRIAELCGLLPLALRVAGMFLAASPHWSAAEFIDALADERERLARLKLEGSADLDVAGSLALSVRELRRTHPDIADQWHELAVFPASFDIAAAAAVWDQSVGAARDGLGVLLSRSLVLYDPAQQRWRLHDLMHDLAGGHAAMDALGAPAELAVRLTAARMQHAEHYHDVLRAADDLYIRGGEHVSAGLALFDRERRNIEAGQAYATDDASRNPAAAFLCVSYPNAGSYVLSLRQHTSQHIAWSEIALAASREIGVRRLEGNALGHLGRAYASLGATRRAIECYEQCLTITQEIGYQQGQVNALGNLSSAYADLGEARRSIQYSEQALVLAREIGSRRSESYALGNLGVAYAGLGETQRAIEYFEEVLLITREIGDRNSESDTLGNLGSAFADLGETGRAIEFYNQDLAIAREIGNRRGEGGALGNLGNAYADLGEPRRAIEFYEQQLMIMREIGDGRGEGAALTNLGNAYEQLGETRRTIESLRGALDVFERIGNSHAAEVRERIPRLEKEGGT